MWCCGACIFLSCVDWRRKLSTSCTSSTSISTKTASPPHTMAVMPPQVPRMKKMKAGVPKETEAKMKAGVPKQTEAEGGSPRRRR